MKVNCTFSREVDGDRVKMLLPSVSNTICKCLQKTFNFVNTDKLAIRRLSPMNKISAVTWRDSKASSIFIYDGIFTVCFFKKKSKAYLQPC